MTTANTIARDNTQANRRKIAQRIVQDIPEGWHVNLGIGIPLLVGGMIPRGHEVLLPGASLFDHALSFSMIRGRHLDLCILGAFEVAENGDLANWSTSATDAAPAVGGAMDLAVGAQRIWIAMEHVAKDGSSKLVQRCRYPLTGMGVVKRIYTDLAVIDVTERGFEVREIFADFDFDTLQSLTDAKLYVPA